METNRLIEILLELQNVVAEIERTRAQATTQQQRIGELEHAQTIRREKISRLVEQLRTMKLRRTELESKLADLDAKRTHTRQRMQEVRTPKELEAITHQLETLDRQASEVEQQALEAIEAEEQMECELTERQNLDAERTGSEKEELSRLRQLLAREKELLTGLETDRKRIAAKLPDTETREIFEWLYKKNGLPVIVPLRGDACGGCSAILPTSVVSEIRTAGHIVHCPHCRRILHPTER